MKIIRYINILLSFVCLFSLRIFAQDGAKPYFEGSIQFEVQMKGPQAEVIKENEPNTQLLMHMKGGNYIVQLSGGKYPKTFIFISDSNYEYSMDMVNKRAFRFSSFTDLNKAEPEEAPLAKSTGTQLEINGVLCDEYKLRKGDALFTYYVNDSYRINTQLYPANTRAKASFLAAGLDGRIPLKTIKQESGITVITTANKITRKEFDVEQFRIPMGFEVKNRDYRY
ncbi:MAG: hypothetical protein SF052_25030 [Bacteroidia bacterium]|nr:hypothetical protein [Bacteroidia bacterium]